MLRARIDFARLPAATPVPVVELLKRCLDRDPKTRLRDMGEARVTIAKYFASPTSGTEVPLPGPARAPKLPWALAAIGIVAALVLALVHFRQTPPPVHTLRYTVAPPENGSVHSFAISPDGRYLVAAVAVNGKRQLWLRALDALPAQAMLGTEGATYPFWSPDNRYIAFFTQGKLKKIATTGGPTQSLCNAVDGRGGSWNRDGVIVFSPTSAEGAIQRVPSAGGVPTDVTKTKGVSRFPIFLPDGRHFLYLLTRSAPNVSDTNGVYLGSLDGKENRRVLADASSVVLAAGHLLFVRGNTLVAQPFNAGKAQASGNMFPLAEGVSFTEVTGFAPVAVSDTGLLVYGTGGSFGNNQIVWYDRAGKILGPVGATGPVTSPSISPDEKTIAFTRGASGNSVGADIWLRDLARGADTRFTFRGSVNNQPSWSPKGDRIAFRSYERGMWNLYQRAANGSGQDDLLLSTANGKTLDQWSRDGRFIVYSEEDQKTKQDLWVLPTGQGASSNQRPMPFLRTEFNEFQGQISPDGRWMAYTSDESGERDVFVRPFQASEAKWRVSIAGGEQPRWRGDCKELFFLGADGKMMAVTVKASTGSKLSPELGTPVPLFESHIVVFTANVGYQYDVTADGKRFLVATNTAAASAPPLTVVVNWLVER